MFVIAAIPLLIAVGGAWGYLRYTKKKDQSTSGRHDANS